MGLEEMKCCMVVFEPFGVIEGELWRGELGGFVDVDDI